jgi:hypothetical protein
MGWFEDVWPIPYSGVGERGYDFPEPMEPKISKDRSFSFLTGERSLINVTGDCSLISACIFHMPVLL